MPRVTGSPLTPFGGAASYIFVDYTVTGQNYANNTTSISWVLGFHYGDAHIRLDNAQCAFSGGPISGDPNGGPYYSGWPAPGGTHQDVTFDSGSFTISHDSNGNRTVGLTAYVTGTYGASTINTSFGLAQIPQNPASPSAASATRNSDTSITVNWTNNSTGTAPYANVKVYRRVNGGSWSLKATLGVVTSYVDNAGGSVSANNKYEYRMSAVGTNGAEVGYGTTSPVWTTPGAPTGANASRLSGGNIRVTWTNNVNYAEYTTRVEVSNNEGGSWAEIGSAASGATSFDHTGPPATNDSYKYRVRARTSSGTTLNSSYSTQSGLIYADPASPSACTATRVNDGQINLAWTNNSTSEAPYANIKVYRSTDGGGFGLITTLGVVTSYSDTTVSANHKYIYRVSVVGSNGSEVGFATATAVYTTPGAPTGIAAVKLANNDIQVTWINNVNYTEYLIEIEETNNGTDWTPLNTSIANGTTTYDHVAPSTGVTHAYRVRAKTSSGTTLFSAYNGPSNTITLLATANPPTNLSPSGVARDAAEVITFTWQHNPADGTAQHSYRIQYEVDGGSTVTIGPTTSSVSSHQLSAATLTNGSTITWRVATAGQNTTLSTNSSTASFTTSARPTSSVDTPTGTISESTVTAEWTYFQAQSSPQASWHAFLYRNTGSGYVLLEEKSGTTEDQTTFATTVLDGLDYAVRVYVTSAAGLESVDAGTELQEFSVSYLPPAQVTLALVYDDDNGQMVITIEAEAAVPTVTEDIDTIDIQRSINGGAWVTWLRGLEVPPGQTIFAVIDVAPTIHGNNNYRAVIHSALPSSDVSAEVDLDTAETRWGFLNAGVGLTERVRMRAELDSRATTGRSKQTHQFAGRTKPVELSGEHTSLAMQVTATLYGPSSTRDELEEIGRTTGPVLFRDYSGRRVFASISDVNTDTRTQFNTTPVSFRLREVDYDENVD